MSSLKLDLYKIEDLTGMTLLYAPARGNLLARCKYCKHFDFCKKKKNVSEKTEYCQWHKNRFEAR